LSPVDAFHQHCQLCWGQEHFAITGRGPGEATTLQPFGQQAQPVASGPQQFNLATAETPEDEDVADIGSSFIAVCTFAVRPLKPFLISVVPATSHILVPEGNGSIDSVPVSAESEAFR